jgi:polar amino acid transport system substrate-binding protein
LEKMLRYTQIFGMGLILVLLASFAAACGSSEGGQVAPPTVDVAAGEESLDEPGEAATAEPLAEPEAEDVVLPLSLGGEELSVAINAQFRPFVYYDDAGELTGFDIEVFQALAQLGDFTFQFTDMPFDDLLPSVARGQYDAAISAITVTDERARVVDFSVPYFETSQSVVSFLGAGQGMAVRVEEADIFSIEDLSPTTRVGVKENTTGDTYASENLVVDVIRYPEVGPLVAALQNEDVDAIIVDVSVIARSIDEDTGIRLTQTGLTEELYAIAVNKDRDDLLHILDAGLATLRESGEYMRLFNQYFGTP